MAMPREIIEMLGGTEGNITFTTRDGITVYDIDILFEEKEDPDDEDDLCILLTGDVFFQESTHIVVTHIYSDYLEKGVELENVMEVTPSWSEGHAAIFIYPGWFNDR